MVDDCTKALEHNNRYIKALFRRAKAAEVTNNLMQCLEGDFDIDVQFYYRATSCNAMHGIAVAILSVRPSVHQTRVL